MNEEKFLMRDTTEKQEITIVVILKKRKSVSVAQGGGI